MKRGHIQKHILKNIDLSPYQPYISHTSMGIIRWLMVGYESDDKITTEMARNSFYNTKKKGYIKELVKKTGQNEAKIKFKLTEKGKKVLRGHEFNDMQIQKTEKWDGYWWVVVFDIPEKDRAIREMLREKLKDLGFIRFQGSVWMYPYECAKEIDLVSEFFHIQQHLLTFKAKLNNDIFAQKYFRQQGLNL